MVAPFARSKSELLTVFYALGHRNPVCCMTEREDFTFCLTILDSSL